MEAGGPEVQDHFQIYEEFVANLRCVTLFGDQKVCEDLSGCEWVCAVDMSGDGHV